MRPCRCRPSHYQDPPRFGYLAGHDGRLPAEQRGCVYFVQERTDGLAEQGIELDQGQRPVPVATDLVLAGRSTHRGLDS